MSCLKVPAIRYTAQIHKHSCSTMPPRRPTPALTPALPSAASLPQPPPAGARAGAGNASPMPTPLPALRDGGDAAKV
jgi:hypothetical protein